MQTNRYIEIERMMYVMDGVVHWPIDEAVPTLANLLRELADAIEYNLRYKELT